MEVEEKNGNPEDNSYNGYGRGSSSLQHVTEKSRRIEKKQIESMEE